jgi:outer membrane protein assembly factor BamD
MTGFGSNFRPGLLAAAGALSAALLLGGCSHDSDEDKYVERPVGKLYNAGMAALAERNYKEASKQFDEVERQHPYSIWATKAELMSAYAHYQANEYQDAINALNRFIQLHPGNRDIAYAYYLKALSYYEQVTDVERDQSNAEQAMTALQELIRRYPDSRYARDAREKIDLVRNHLAGKEMDIGRFYQKRDFYLAAINRFRTVVDKYQTTAQVPEALERLVECYTSLGLVNEARRTAVILGYNYPRSEWYAYSYDLVHDLKPGGQPIAAPKMAQGNAPASAQPAALGSSPALAPPAETGSTENASNQAAAAPPAPTAAPGTIPTADAGAPAPTAAPPAGTTPTADAGAPAPTAAPAPGATPTADAGAAAPNTGPAPAAAPSSGAPPAPATPDNKQAADQPAVNNKPKETTAEVGRGPAGFFAKAWDAIF